jgi:serine/threonine protein kinase
MSRYRDGDEPVPGYRLIAFLGEGSNSEVWKALGPGRTEFAMKFLGLDSTQGMKEFKSIVLVKRLRHPNLIPIYALWLRDPGGNVLSDDPVADEGPSSVTVKLGGPKDLIIAMGLGEMSLAQRAEQARPQGGIPIRQLLNYLEGAARGIDYLNSPIHAPENTPIIHGDIKPGNLLIVGGEVQVGDYGVARALGADPRKVRGVGSPVYAPPELINNDPSPQTDQYSLAITYFELRTGRLPFERAKALVANLTGALDLSPLAPAERAVIRRATSAQPAKRFPTVVELVEELKIACAGAPVRSGVLARPGGRAAPEPAEPDVPDGGVEETLAFPSFPSQAGSAPTVIEPELSTWATDDAPAEGKEAPGRWWLWVLLAAVLLGAGAAAVYFASRTASG